MKQSLVTKKNRKGCASCASATRTSNVQVFYQKDFENLIFRRSAERPVRHERVRDSGVERVLFTEAQIDARIRELARRSRATTPAAPSSWGCAQGFDLFF